MKQKLNTWIYGCLVLLGSMATQKMQAQSCPELVSNGGFETLSTSLISTSQIDVATGWYAHLPGGIGAPTSGYTPDLYHTATLNPDVGVPCNWCGDQNGHNSSNGYAGILTISKYSHQPNRNEEFLAAYFSSALVAGKIYEVSFWVSRAESADYYISSLGVWINGDPFTDPTTYNCPTASLNNDAWTKISFPYCAAGGESYIAIGGTSPVSGSGVTPLATSCPAVWAANDDYIYIDDVSVKEAQFSVASQTVCSGSSVSLNAVSCGVDAANFTYLWDFGDGSSPVSAGVNTSHTYASPGTYSGSFTVISGACSVMHNFNVYVPAVTIAVTSNTNTICNGPANFSASPSPSGSYTYVWTLTDISGSPVTMPGGSTSGITTANATIDFTGMYANLNICVTVTSSLGCTYTQCIYRPSCCATPTHVTKYANHTFTSNTTISTPNVSFGGIITINPGITLALLNTNAQLDPNTKFVLAGTSSTFSVQNSYLHACNAMWDGVYPLGRSIVIFNNSRVEDAQRVVVDSLGGTSLTFSGNYINKNYIGIAFKAAKGSPSTVSIKNNLFTCSNITAPATPYSSNPVTPTTPNLTNAATLGAFSTTNLMLPYNTLKSYAGIYFKNASHTGQTNTAITIGTGTNGNENVFDKMQYGVSVNTSNVILQNNVFQNIKNSIAPVSGGGANAAVDVNGGTSGSSYYTRAGGAGAGFKNTFSNNDLGVAVHGQTGLLVEYNRLETQYLGVYVYGNNNNSTAQVTHNKFVNNTCGVLFDQNTIINTNIQENWMDNTSAQGSYADNFAIRCTEAVTATNPSSYPVFDINNNYITGYYNGIYMAHTYRADVRDNEVHMRPDLAGGHYQSGIAIVQTDESDVANNTIDMPNGTTATWSHSGIFMDNNTEPEIRCNSIDYIYAAILANYLNYTVAGYGIYSNTMQHATYGFWLNAGGEIGHQYYNTTTYSADNQWSNFTNETYVNSGCNSAAAKFYTRNTSPYNITNPGTAGPPTLSGIVATGGFAGSCSSSSTPTLNLRMNNSGQDVALMQYAQEIADGSMSFGENEESSKQNARRMLYRLLALKQIDLNIEDDFSAFVNTERHTTTGQFFVVDSLINTGEIGNLQTALANNNTVTTVTDIEKTQQQFNDLYIVYLNNNGSLTVADITAMESIAELCPNLYGRAVQQARTILFSTTHKKYVNPCEFNDNGQQERKAPKQATTANRISVFPNPSSGIVSFETADDLNYNVTVYNVLGEKMFDGTIANKQIIDLSALPSATYIVLIKQNESVIKTERISIIH